MLAIEVEGVYESDVGTGQKKYTEFNYTIKTSRLTEKGIHTHIAKRFIPMLIAGDKSKKDFFSRLKSFNILKAEKIKDDKDNIIGKKIDELDAKQLQDLACTFDLYDVPLYGKCTENEMRQKAMYSYLKKVWNIDLNEKNTDGTLKYESDEVVIEVPQGYFQKKKKESQTFKVSELMKKAGQVIADGLLAVTSNSTNSISQDENIPNDNDNFPSANDLNS